MRPSLTPSALGALPLFGGSTVARLNRVIAATTTRSFNTASFSQLAVDKEASAQRHSCVLSTEQIVPKLKPVQ